MTPNPFPRLALWVASVTAWRGKSSRSVGQKMGSTAVENCHTALLTFSLALTAAARGVIPSGKPLDCNLAQIGKSTRYNAGHSNSGQRQLPALRTFARHPSGSPELIACMSASEKAGSNTSHSIPSKADLAGNREVCGALLRRTRSPVRPSSPGPASAAAADRTQRAVPHSAPPSNWCRVSQGPPSVRSGPLVRVAVQVPGPDHQPENLHRPRTRVGARTTAMLH